MDYSLIYARTNQQLAGRQTNRTVLGEKTCFPDRTTAPATTYFASLIRPGVFVI